MDLESLAFGAIFLLIGLAIAVWGVLTLRKWYYVRAGEPISIRDVFHASNPVEVEGTIRPVDEEDVLQSPIMQKPCVAYEYKVEERQRRRRSGKNNGSKTTWKTVDSGENRVPFYLEDDSGRALVRPDGASLSMAKERTRTVEDESALPSGMRGSGGVLSIGSISIGSRPIRYTEKRLDVDDSGYVFGEAIPNPQGVDADVELGDGEETPMFLVSDTSEGATARRLLLKGVGLAAFGAIFAVAGIAVMLGAA